MDDKAEALFNEYKNLWEEKLTHKQSIRKFHNYITYLISISSLALTFKGLSATDIVIDSSKVVANASDIVSLLFVPFTPIVIIVLSFAVNDLFQIYAIGNQIGQIEQKINKILGKKNLLVWEHRICPIIYGGVHQLKDGKEIEKISNLIKLNDFFT